MIPISLTLRGFLSYKEEVTLDFTTFEIACIAGANGAGKSSLLDAITYSLFGKARKTDETLINLQSESAFVELVFGYEGNRYRIQRTNPRGKTSILEFQIAQLNEGQPASETQWKTLTERTSRLTQTRIEETLRLDYDTFINAAFFLQGNADQFTQQRPAERKRILGNILGLEIWESYRSQAVAKRKRNEAEIAALDGRLVEINNELAQEDERKTHLADLDRELESLASARTTQESVLENMKKVQATFDEQQKIIDTLARQLTATQQRAAEIKARHSVRVQEKEAIVETMGQAQEIQQAYEKLLVARASLTEWDATAAKFQEQEARRREPLAAIRETKARLETESETLLKHQAEIVKTQAQTEIQKSDLTEHKKALAELEASLAQKSALEVDLTAALEKQAEARAENPRLKAEMNSLKTRIDQLSQTEGADCPLCGQPLPADRRVELIAELEGEGKEKGDKYRTNQETLAAADEGVLALQAQVTKLQSVETTHRARFAVVTQLETQIATAEQDAHQWQAESAPRLAAIQDQLANESYAQDSRTELARIDAELKEIGYDAGEHDRIRQEVELGAALEEKVRTLEMAEAALVPLDREIEELQEQLAKTQAEADKQQEEHQAAAAIMAAAKEDLPNVQQAQRDLLNIQERENRLRMEVGAAQQKVKVLDDLRVRQKAIDGERAGFAVQVAQYKQLEKAFGKDGVPALLIEQALPQIEAKANELLERLSGGEMAVRFQTQRELKSRDDLKETLDIIISDAAGTRDYEMYSGGEAFRVNFAIRLALSEVLAQRAGARLQTLVIDEGFGSQDVIGRQRLIESINMVKGDFAKILVITHIDELKDAFPTRIEVEKSARGSQVAVIN